MATNATHRIKNLSIALEALSRINTERSNYYFVQIESLLDDEITKAKKENQWPRQGPAKPSTDDEAPF